MFTYSTRFMCSHAVTPNSSFETPIRDIARQVLGGFTGLYMDTKLLGMGKHANYIGGSGSIHLGIIIFSPIHY